MCYLGKFDFDVWISVDVDSFTIYFVGTVDVLSRMIVSLMVLVADYYVNDTLQGIHDYHYVIIFNNHVDDCTQHSSG